MDFNTLAQNIIDAHPESVRQLLKGKGVTKPASPLVLLQAYQIWGAPFLTELVDIIYDKPSNYIDPETGVDSTLLDVDTSLPADLQNQPTVSQIADQRAYDESVRLGQQKSTLWSDLSSVFSSAAKVITSVKGTSSTTGISANVNPATTKSSGNTMLIIGILVIVILGVVIFIIKKKKK